MFKFFNRGISTPVAIGIVVVLAILVVGGILAYQYYLMPKGELPKTETPKDETADWKIYKNDEYGFEIKYPPDSQVEEKIEDVLGNKNIAQEACVVINFDNGSIFIATPENKIHCGTPTDFGIGATKVEELVKIGKKNYKMYGYRDQDNEEMKYKSNITYEFLDTQLENKVFILFSLQSDKKLNSDGYNKTKNTIYDILSTFKFTR